MNLRYLFVNNKKRFNKVVDKYKPIKKSKEEILVELLQNTKGKQKLAEAISIPFTQQLNYESLSTRVFDVQPLPPGALAFFPNNDE